MTRLKGGTALVVGAGVSGLTTAVTLAEAGMAVTVIADRQPLATTSAVAGASWGPYLAGHGQVLAWSSQSRETFVRLSQVAGSGVRLIPGMEAYDNMETIPDWATQVPGFTICSTDEVPEGYVGAWKYTIPLIDMPVYLDYLLRRLRVHGIAVTIVPTLRSLPQAGASAATVINCSGMGSAALLADTGMSPCRGQLAVVENPGVTHFFQDNVDGDEFACIFPHGDTVVLGGVSQPGSCDMEYDLGQERRMLERCARIEPKLAGAPVVGRRVGLRPQRKEIRVERDNRLDGVIHNYGHGGSGVTLSWGCAAQVLDLIRSG